MSLSIKLSSSGLPEHLRRFASQLGGPAAADMTRAMGAEVQQVTALHLRQLAATRHATAQRLGAAPSNHLARAAEQVAAPAALTTITGAENAAVLTINHPGMVRAFRDVRIVPQTAKALAIPIHAMAYNRRPSQLALEGHKLFVLGGKKNDTGKAVLATKVGGDVLPLYLLRRSVTQKQDRSLLPNEEEWARAAGLGVATYIHQKISNA